MALADLRALARRQAPTPEAVTPATRTPLPAGYRMEAQKIEENRQLQEAATPVTPVTRASSNLDVEERTAPTNDLAPTVEKPAPVLTDAEWVEGMAAALMANPVYQITNSAKALEYFRGRALAILDATPDPYARGLMLGYERHRHVMVVHGKATGR
jgi:hypothetical protein